MSFCLLGLFPLFFGLFPCHKLCLFPLEFFPIFFHLSLSLRRFLFGNALFFENFSQAPLALAFVFHGLAFHFPLLVQVARLNQLLLSVNVQGVFQCSTFAKQKNHNVSVFAAGNALLVNLKFDSGEGRDPRDSLADLSQRAGRGHCIEHTSWRLEQR